MKKCVSKSDQTKQKIYHLAHDIYDQYFEAAQANPPSGIMAKLANVVIVVESAMKMQNTGSR